MSAKSKSKPSKETVTIASSSDVGTLSIKDKGKAKKDEGTVLTQADVQHLASARANELMRQKLAEDQRKYHAKFKGLKPKDKLALKLEGMRERLTQYTKQTATLPGVSVHLSAALSGLDSAVKLIRTLPSSSKVTHSRVTVGAKVVIKPEFREVYALFASPEAVAGEWAITVLAGAKLCLQADSGERLIVTRKEVVLPGNLDAGDEGDDSETEAEAEA